MKTPPLRWIAIAIAAPLLGASVYGGVVLRRPTRADGAATSKASLTGPPNSVVHTETVAAPNDVVSAIVERNPFRPDRSRSIERYQLEGSSEVSIVQPSPAPPDEPVRPTIPEIRLVGLVALGSGRGMAAVEVAGSNARLLSIGDSIAGFRLVSVTGSEAKLSRPDTTLLLSLKGP